MSSKKPINQPLVVPNRSAPVRDEYPEGAEPTEITAEIFVPPEGGWGWVVVFTSFWCNFILDGVLFTFGSIFKDMTDDLGIEGTLVATINSVSIALYFIAGPLVSALTNSFGFRACAMAGSVIVALSYLCTYYAHSYGALLFLFGVIPGFGGSLILVPNVVIVGFYFERLRPLALALSGLGSYMGITSLAFFNSYIVNIAGWRVVVLIHSAFFAMAYFLSMAYRPVTVLTITQTTETDDPTRTVTYLPNLSKSYIQKAEGTEATATERLFSAVSSPNFPTATTVMEEGLNSAAQKNTQGGQPVSKIKISARNLTSVSRKQVQSVTSRIQSFGNKDKIRIDLIQEEVEAAPKKWWSKLFCCVWKEHASETRPMYRDDAFYEGKIEHLPVYQKSVMAVNPDERTGLEYQMAVSRVVPTAELEERQGLCSTAVRRVLATMMDPQLLKRCSFILISCSLFLVFVGLLTPYVFLKDRCINEGIEERHCNLFLSVIGFFNAIGRFIITVLAAKVKPQTLYIFCCILAGIGTIGYNLSFEVYYQYCCCVLFGLFISGPTGLRSMVIVEGYGLEKLTNATGMVLLFQGLGSLISSPVCGLLKQNFGYPVSFYVAGSVLILSGLIVLPVTQLLKKENKLLEKNAIKESKR